MERATADRKPAPCEERGGEEEEGHGEARPSAGAQSETGGGSRGRAITPVSPGSEAPCGEGDEAEDRGGGGVAGGVVKTGLGCLPVGAHDPGESERAREVAGERAGDPDPDESRAAISRETEEVAEEEGDHETGLEGLDPAAGGVHAEDAVLHLDEVASLEGGDAGEVEGIGGKGRDDAHQKVSEGDLDSHGPGESGPRENEGKGHASAQGGPAEAVEPGEGEAGGARGGEPVDKSPEGIQFTDELGEKDEEEAGEHGRAGRAWVGLWNGLRAVGEAEPDENGEKQWDTEPVAVVFAEPPFAGELPPQPEPTARDRRKPRGAVPAAGEEGGRRIHWV